MQRLRFKTPFNGMDNALKLIHFMHRDAKPSEGKRAWDSDFIRAEVK